MHLSDNGELDVSLVVHEIRLQHGLGVGAAGVQGVWCGHGHVERCGSLVVNTADGDGGNRTYTYKASKEVVFRNASVEKIEDPDVLYDLVFKADDKSIRRSAILKDSFTSEDILQKVVMEDKDESVKMEAVRKIENEDLLADIALSEDNAKIRSIIFEKIENPDILKDILLKSPKSDVRLDIIKKIDDEELLTSIALNDSDKIVRSEAVKKITNEENLLKIISNDEDRFVRQIAVKNLNNPKELIKIALNDDDQFVRNHAISNPALCDESDFVYIAINSTHEEIAFEALRQPRRLAEVKFLEEKKEALSCESASYNEVSFW